MGACKSKEKNNKEDKDNWRYCKARGCRVKVYNPPKHPLRTFCAKHLKIAKVCVICKDFAVDTNALQQCFDCTKVHCRARNTFSCSANADMYKEDKTKPTVFLPEVICSDCAAPCQGKCGWYCITPETIGYHDRGIYGQVQACDYHGAQRCAGIETIDVRRGLHVMQCDSSLPFLGPKLCKKCTKNLPEWQQALGVLSSLTDIKQEWQI